MAESNPTLAELRALRDHVVALHEVLADRGFVMASDTRVRLQQANALIADGGGLTGVEAAARDTEAESLATLLRSEAGKVEP